MADNMLEPYAFSFGDANPASNGCSSRVWVSPTSILQSKIRVCGAQRSNESPSGAFKRQNGLRQQMEGPRPQQVRRCIYVCIACYNGVGSEKLTASELYRCPNLSYNEDVLRERSIA